MVTLYESPTELLHTFEEYLQTQRAEGKKCIAYLAHEFVPPELILAMGAIPLPLIIAGDETVTTAGSDYLTPTMCPFALSLLGSFKDREEHPRVKFLQYVDAVISTNYCAADTLINEWMADFAAIPRLTLHIPFLHDDHHHAYYFAELIRLIS